MQAVRFPDSRDSKVNRRTTQFAKAAFTLPQTKKGVLTTGSFDVDGDRPPFSLKESGDAQNASGDVAGEDGEPYVQRLKRAEILDGEADAKRDCNL